MSKQWGIIWMWNLCYFDPASLEQWRRGPAPNLVFSPDPPKALVFSAALNLTQSRTVTASLVVPWSPTQSERQRKQTHIFLVSLFLPLPPTEESVRVLFAYNVSLKATQRQIWSKFARQKLKKIRERTRLKYPLSVSYKHLLWRHGTTSLQSLGSWESVASYVFRECGRQSFPTIVFINIPEMPGIGRVTWFMELGKSHVET